MNPVVSLTARHLSVPFEAGAPELAVGTPLRRDLVLVRVECADGAVGYGEAFHGQAGGAVAEVVRTTLQPLVVGRPVEDTAGLSRAVHDRCLSGNGTGAIRLALSGVDLAMWDAHGKSLGVPVHRLLGGSDTDFPAYAGGFALGFQPPEELMAELAATLQRSGWRAVKIRIGRDPVEDVARVRAAREGLGSGMRLMVDANLGQRYEIARIVPALRELDVEWLEEPYERTARRRYAELRRTAGVPLAGGENLHGAAEFLDWIEAGALDVVQPDASRTGGITEMLRIAAVARAAGVRFVPHISHSVLNHAAALHVMSAVAGGDLVEGDASVENGFRDGPICGGVTYADGRAVLTGGAGLGVDVDEHALDELAGGPGSPFPATR
ncbi:mandelate racemase/muconate lactonizing enzyme family protein [Nocardioides sp. KR10-350]|uniref:mandelate racemase/muconate lactonizing enzyme family protein n=1 Tax=Nocardioides cheoyonin TaxID=3156615 RepID=UPI0032B51245